MKKIKYFLIGTLFISVINFSCKKDSDSSSTTKVEYRITPMNVYFTKITYTDQSGSDITITDPSQFSSGSKSISITSKPFNASITTQVNNTTSGTITFNLAILVNEKVMANVEGSAPPFVTNYVASTEYRVQ